jgi:hypothetical protein
LKRQLKADHDRRDAIAFRPLLIFLGSVSDLAAALCR